jgi:hypothetical protein
MKNYLLIFSVFLQFGLFSQVDNTMYGLQQLTNPPSFKLASLDPLTGQINTIGSSVLSTVVNATGSALNPYNQTYSFQDEDSWLTVDLQTGTVLSDVTVTLPNSEGNFNNFRFNAADSNMYGLYSEVISDPVTGFVNLEMKLATCDLSTGLVNLISPNSVAQSYTMSGSTIDPYLMVYYFESEGKFMGLDLYNGQIYSQPTMTVMGAGSYFSNFAYSCADTSVYGLIMQNGVKALGKINPQTGVVTALPTQLNYDSFIMNTGGAIDPVNLVYYFQTMDTTAQIKLVGLSLIDGSVAIESYISPIGDYFTMYRIQSECYEATPSRLNPMNSIAEVNNLTIEIHPNPVQDVLHLTANMVLDDVELLDLFGHVIERYSPSEMDLQIPLKSLVSGIYYLRVSSSGSIYTERFIKD